MKSIARRVLDQRLDFREMASWSDEDLQRVEELRRELESTGLPRAEASRRAATAVRRARQGRQNAW